MLGGAVTGRPCPSTSPSSMKPSGPCCPSSGSTSEPFGSLIFFIEPFLPVSDGLMCPCPLYDVTYKHPDVTPDRLGVGLQTPSGRRLPGVGPRQRLDARPRRPQVAQRLLVRPGESRQVRGLGSHEPGCQRREDELLDLG